MPEVLADTAEFIALSKPAGLITHSDGRTTEPSVAEWIAEHYPALREVGTPWVSPQGERVRVCGLVHRLDRATSGVLIAAKNAATFARLKEAFRERTVEKHYRAIVHGHIEHGTGTIVAEIARSSTPPRRWYATPTTTDDKRAAITEWNLLQRLSFAGESISYLDLVPRTGRTHQLRVHLASIGHPILGDTLYGETVEHAAFPRLALHAYRISYEFAGTRHTYEAPLPMVLSQYLD